MGDLRPAIRHYARNPYAYAIEPYSLDHLSHSNTLFYILIVPTVVRQPLIIFLRVLSVLSFTGFDATIEKAVVEYSPTTTIYANSTLDGISFPSDGKVTFPSWGFIITSFFFLYCRWKD